MIPDCLISPQHLPCSHQKALFPLPPASTILFPQLPRSYLSLPIYRIMFLSLSLAPILILSVHMALTLPFLTAVQTNSSLPKAAVS